MKRDKAVAYYVYYKNWKGWFAGATYYCEDEKRAFSKALADVCCYDTTIIGIDVRRRPLPAKPKRVDRLKMPMLKFQRYSLCVLPSGNPGVTESRYGGWYDRDEVDAYFKRLSRA